MSHKVTMHGAAGRMGRAIIGILDQASDATLHAAVEHAGASCLGSDPHVLAGKAPRGLAIGADLLAGLMGADVVIDFSLPAATEAVIAACRAARVPLVMGTTGLSPAQRASLGVLAQELPVVFAPNYSQGVTALFHLAKRATELLGPDFQAEITETHHRHKIDSPSGTAMRLAEVVAEAKGVALGEAGVYGREGQVGARTRDEIGVLALRGGDVVGEHTLFLFGEGERIEITHRATDRTIFARGAVRAANWVVAQPPGLYDMFDVMGAAR
ncbi:MAG: 4-hydroxy-tetrahydrodipicolinate reductase [Sandaracinaceae bacterium]|nr:4-hydroxy-tetrahydrodipicolinate reductase [Sandaracinaceae bacterium]